MKIKLSEKKGGMMFLGFSSRILFILRKKVKKKFRIVPLFVGQTKDYLTKNPTNNYYSQF